MKKLIRFATGAVFEVTGATGGSILELNGTPPVEVIDVSHTPLPEVARIKQQLHAKGKPPTTPGNPKKNKE